MDFGTRLRTPLMQQQTIRVTETPADQQAFGGLVHDYID
jgi:hypothetical protein